MHREELCSLKVKDLQSRQRVIHFKVKEGSLFRPVRNNHTGELERPLNANSLYRNVVRKYGQAAGLNMVIDGPRNRVFV